MFKDLWIKYNWVLDPLEYPDGQALLKVLDAAIIAPALKKHAELLAAKAQDLRTRNRDELQLIGDVVKRYAGLSRMELARTVCELLQWQRSSGKLKARECREFLERLDSQATELSKVDKRSVNGSMGSAILFWNTPALLCLN